MSNIYLKVTIATLSKLRFSGFKNLITRSVFGKLQLTQKSLNFKTSCYNLKIISLGLKLCVAFLFSFERNYDVIKSQNPCILLNKKINFNEDKTKSKMKNSTYDFREMNLVLQLI